MGLQSFFDDGMTERIYSVAQNSLECIFMILIPMNASGHGGCQIYE